MQVTVATQISTYYAFVAFMIASNAVPMGETIPSALNIGLLTFIVGELGNVYHHNLLRQLKEERTKEKRRYVPPRGGLFEMVATPHYFFEVVAWVGIALVAQQFNAYMEIFSVLGYFWIRSKRTNEMYFKTFSKEEWPRSRKNLIPLVY